MITCVCPNPAIDVTYDVDRLRIGDTHRVVRVARAGGKATNTARVLQALGADTHVIAPLGGSSGDAFAEDLRSAGLSLTVVAVSGATRSTITVVDPANATVFSEAGPCLTAAEWDRLCDSVSQVESSVVVISGSLPPLPRTASYADLVRAARPARVVVDAGGTHLAAALAEQPDVVCPNIVEARAALTSGGDLPTILGVLLRAGARAAVVSNGEAGLVARAQRHGWVAVPPYHVRGNPTGAGDAVTAAIAHGLADDAAWPQILQDAIATSAAAVAASVAGDIDAAVRHQLLQIDTVRELTDATRPHD